MANRVDKLADGVGDGTCDVPQLQVSGPSFTGVDREAGVDLAHHVHVRARGIAGDLQDYCAVVQHSPVHPDGAICGEVLAHAQLHIAEPQPPEMDKSVLVLVPEVVDGPEVRQ